MKILMLNHEFPPVGGGASPVTFELCRHVAGLGHDVDVVTMRYGSLPAFERVAGVNVYRTWALRGKPNISHPHELASYLAGAVGKAVQLAREEKIGLVESVKFVLKKYLSYIGAPVFPIVGILFFVVLCVLGGLLGRIPWFGEIFAGVLWVLPLIAGFVMVIIAIGLVLGWPLMYATISAEGSDSFDAISRSYSYIYQRPWRYAWYWVVSVLYGAIVIAFVTMFTLGML